MAESRWRLVRPWNRQLDIGDDMTLEELGQTYLDQVEHIIKRIEALEAELEHPTPDASFNFAQKMHDIAVLKSLQLELSTTGYQLINYYRR